MFNDDITEQCTRNSHVELVKNQHWNKTRTRLPSYYGVTDAECFLPLLEKISKTIENSTSEIF